MKKWMCLLLAGVLLLCLTTCKKPAESAGETDNTESTLQQETGNTQTQISEVPTGTGYDGLDDLSESYQQVLNNEKKFWAQGQGEMFLKNYLFPGSDNSDISIGNVTDWDGQKMLAIQQLNGIVVLCEANGAVYGNRYGVREMYNLRVNGVYDWTYTDDQGLHYGANRLVFKDGKFADEELYCVDQSDEGEIKYTLAGAEATEAEVQAFEESIKADEVTWVELFDMS